MASDLAVVPFERKFMKDLISLWRERYSADYTEKRSILYEWFTDGNPLSPQDNCYFLLVSQGRAIGFHGRMPMRFHLNGREIMGYIAHDALLATELRGKALGKALTIGMMEQTPRICASLWFNEPIRRIHEKMGWLDRTRLLWVSKNLRSDPFR